MRSRRGTKPSRIELVKGLSLEDVNNREHQFGFSPMKPVAFQEFDISDYMVVAEPGLPSAPGTAVPNISPMTAFHSMVYANLGGEAPTSFGTVGHFVGLNETAFNELASNFGDCGLPFQSPDASIALCEQSSNPALPIYQSQHSFQRSFQHSFHQSFQTAFQNAFQTSFQNSFQLQPMVRVSPTQSSFAPSMAIANAPQGKNKNKRVNNKRASRRIASCEPSREPSCEPSCESSCNDSRDVVDKVRFAVNLEQAKPSVEKLLRKDVVESNPVEENLKRLAMSPHGLMRIRYMKRPILQDFHKSFGRDRDFFIDRLQVVARGKPLATDPPIKGRGAVAAGSFRIYAPLVPAQKPTKNTSRPYSKASRAFTRPDTPDLARADFKVHKGTVTPPRTRSSGRRSEAAAMPTPPSGPQQDFFTPSIHRETPALITPPATVIEDPSGTLGYLDWNPPPLPNEPFVSGLPDDTAISQLATEYSASASLADIEGPFSSTSYLDNPRAQADPGRPTCDAGPTGHHAGHARPRAVVPSGAAGTGLCTGHDASSHNHDHVAFDLEPHANPWEAAGRGAPATTISMRSPRQDTARMQAKGDHLEKDSISVPRKIISNKLRTNQNLPVGSLRDALQRRRKRRICQLASRLDAVHHPNGCPIKTCTWSIVNFTSRQDFLSHMKTAHGSEVVTCVLCGISFSRRDALMRHVRTLHKEDLAELPDALSAKQAVWREHAAESASLRQKTTLQALRYVQTHPMQFGMSTIRPQRLNAKSLKWVWDQVTAVELDGNIDVGLHLLALKPGFAWQYRSMLLPYIKIQPYHRLTGKRLKSPELSDRTDYLAKYTSERPVGHRDGFMENVFLCVRTHPPSH